MKARCVRDGGVLLVVAAESAHGEGDLLWLCVGGEGLVPAGLPYGAVLRVAEKWRSWVGAVDWVLDADVCTSVVCGGEEEESAAGDFVVPLELMGVCRR